MNQYEAETLVRDALRDHEHLVSGGAQGLAAAVRVRADRRRRTRRAAGLAAAAVAVLAAGGITVTAAGGRMQSVTGPVTTGWRWESSLGAEILVPGDWTLDDLGCGMTGRPSVVRYPRFETLCATEEPATKEVAIFGTSPVQPAGQASPQPVTQLVARPVIVDGVPATRRQWRLPDGRYAGSIEVPSREVGLSVRTVDEAKTSRILDSLRLVEYDRSGCPAMRPTPGPDTGQIPAATFVPPEPTSINVCIYHNENLPWMPRVDGRLRASRTLTGDLAKHLAAGLNAAKPGGNPDRPPGECTREGPAEPDARLLVNGDGIATTVWVTFNSCTGRGLDNGVRRARLTIGLTFEIMGGLGFSMPVSLPD